MAFVVWAGKISEASLFKPAISRPKLCRETGLESPKIGEIFRPLRGLYDERTIRAPFWCNELEMTLNMHSDGALDAITAPSAATTLADTVCVPRSGLVTA